MTIEAIENEYKSVYPDYQVVYDKNMEEPDTHRGFTFADGDQVIANVDHGQKVITWNDSNMAKKLMLEKRILAAQALLNDVEPLAKTYESASAEAPR